MARARNIKPGFFKNDELAENDPLGRLLFAGLWTIADYKGELEWRTKRIKSELLPYDDCDIEKLAINLDLSGFIRFYSDGEKIYCKVLGFDEHQNPHKNERDKGSKIPQYSEEGRQLIDLQRLTINRDKSRVEPFEDGTDPADSLNLIPDSLNPRGSKKSKAPKRKKIDSNLELSDHNRNLALGYWAERDRGDLDPDDQFFKFKSHHVAHGKALDWDAAWKTWYANAIKFEKPTKSPPGVVENFVDKHTDRTWAKNL